MNAPRALYTDFPLGHTAGPPNDPQTQLAIARAAVAAVETITESGTIVPLDHSWREQWRELARVPEDHRTVRHETPQYQSEIDREAAIAAHGEAVACTNCTPI